MAVVRPTFSRRGPSAPLSSLLPASSLTFAASLVLAAASLVLLVLSYAYVLSLPVGGGGTPAVLGAGAGAGAGGVLRGRQPGPAPPASSSASSAGSPASPPDAPGDPAVAVVGYAVSLTGCPGPGGDSLADGAAVLRHSIHLSSAAHPPSGSRYGYRMYAIVHPDAKDCMAEVERAGYEVLIRDVPVPVAEIGGKFLREKVGSNGCCGEREYVKLHAYTLVRHPVVVHLDLDTVVLRPMDALFDAMLEGERGTGARARGGDVPVMFGAPIFPRDRPIDAFFTRDYNMVKAGRKHVGVQGGFLVLRPSMEAYRAYSDVIREGNFVEGKGWGGLGYGPFYGSLTFQGIVPYYYDELHPGTAVELDRCEYNAMADNPRDGRTVDNVVHGKCRDGREECEDCRERDVRDVATAHFTVCQKPWSCLPHSQEVLQHRLCRDLTTEWFRIRSDLEGRRGDGGYLPGQFYGFCARSGGRGYIPIRLEDVRASKGRVRR